MYKKLSYLLISFVLLGGSLSASSLFAPSNFDPEDSTKFTITYKTFKPSRVYGAPTTNPGDQSSVNKYDDGFGFAVNFLNFEYSTFYDNGNRYIAYYSFANNSPVNPYIGLSYINNTKIRDTSTKTKIDGVDGLFGIEVSYFRYINPYFEFMPITSLWMFGVRFKLSTVIEKRDAVPAKPKNENQQINTNQGAVANTEEAQASQTPEAQATTPSNATTTNQ